jgi:hypothetical protein
VGKEQVLLRLPVSIHLQASSLRLKTEGTGTVCSSSQGGAIISQFEAAVVTSSGVLVCVLGQVKQEDRCQLSARSL